MLLLGAAVALAKAPAVEVGFEDGTVRIRNTGADPLVLDGISLVDPRAWTAPGAVPSVVAPGAEVTVALDGAGEPPATIVVRTGSGGVLLHLDGAPAEADAAASVGAPRVSASESRAIIAVASRAARDCTTSTAEDVYVSFAVRVGTEGRALGAWIDATGRRSGAVEQCLVDAVRAPTVRYPRLDRESVELLHLSFPAAREMAALSVKRWDDILVLANRLDGTVVVEEIAVLDGDGSRVDVERPTRIQAHRQRTFAVRGERPPAAQLLIRTSVGVQVEPNWEPIEAGGALLQADIDRVLADGEERIQACRTDPKLEGAVSVRLAVVEDGTVAEASVKATSLPSRSRKPGFSGVSATRSGSVEQCVLDEVRALRFPAPTGGGPVPVATAFVFP